MELKAAYDAEPHYKVKSNIGPSLTKLHRYVEAKKELEDYLGEGDGDISEKDKLAVQEIRTRSNRSSAPSLSPATCRAPRSSSTTRMPDLAPSPSPSRSIWGFTSSLSEVEVSPGDHNVLVMGTKYLASYHETVHEVAGRFLGAIVDGREMS